MSEIKLQVDDRYLQVFLEYLKTLNYVEVSKVSTVKLKQNTDLSSNSFTEVSLVDPIKIVLRNPNLSTSLEDALINKTYRQTDLEGLNQFSEELSIPESIDELISQLAK